MIEKNRPPAARSIDGIVSSARDHQAAAALLDREAIASVPIDIMRALRLALLASELRAATLREVLP